MLESSGTLAPMGAERGREDENTERKGWGVPASTRERMMKLKRRKHMNDVEVQRVKVSSNMQQKEVSDPDQGGQIVNTPLQVQSFTAVNHNQLPGTHTIQPRSEWVAALSYQKWRAEQTERQRTRKVKEAKKWALKIPKKPLSPEEKRERNRRKHDRHQALRTPQMIADDKASRQKLWKGELAQLPHSRGVQFKGQGGPVS